MTIRHILADGTEVESIEGRVIPPTGATEAVYRLVAEFLTRSITLQNRPIKQPMKNRNR